jgi:hypothetical protein
MRVNGNRASRMGSGVSFMKPEIYGMKANGKVVKDMGRENLSIITDNWPMKVIGKMGTL